MKRWTLVAGLALWGCIAPGTEPVEPYLGQAPPGIVPEIFAPGLVSRPDAYEYGSVWSADGRELYFGVNVGERAEIRCIRWSDVEWTPAAAVISHPLHTFGDPVLSPGEERLYFISNRPLDQLDGPSKDFDIWFVERDGEGWSHAANLASPVNSSSDEYYISFSSQGRIYFASNSGAGERRRNFDLYSADPTASGFAAPQPLAGSANTLGYEADAFVAPDESYIIYSAVRGEGLGEGDLYISLRGEDGSWSEGVNLGPPINTEGHELCPSVTADGRFFFYTSAEDIYWVDAAILEPFQRSAIR